MKRFRLSNGKGWNAIVLIDPLHPLIDRAIREMVDLAGDGPERAAAHGGDYTRAFLQLLAETIQPLAQRMDTKQVIDELLTTGGWAPLDGFVGITLEDVGHFRFPEVSFTELAA
jgi:hypothetical protein